MKSIFLQILNPLTSVKRSKIYNLLIFVLICVLEKQLNTKKTSLRDNTIILLKIETACDKYFYIVKYCVVK